MNLLIYERDQLLLRKSETIKKYPHLLKVLDDYRNKKVYYKDLDKFDEETQRELKQIDMIRKSAELEWEPLSKTDYTPNMDKYKCSRCNTRIMYIRFIRNIITKEEYPVGRECIDHVRDLFLKHGIDLYAMEREDERIRRAMEIEERFNDIKFIIENWNNVLDESPIMIPNDVELLFLTARRELNSAYTRCIDNSITNKDILIMDKIYNRHNEFYENIKQFIENNKDNEWVATRSIEQWLKRKREFALLNKLKQTGIITKEIASDIYEFRFMKFISNKLRIIFAKRGIAGWEPKQDERGYLIKVQNIRLIVDHKKVIERYWDHIYNGAVCDNYIFADILVISKIYNKDYDKAEKELRKYFYMSKLSLYSMNYDRDEIILKEKSLDDKFLKYRFVPFIDLCKFIVFNIPNIDIQKIQNEIMTTSTTRYEFEDIKSYREQMQRDIYEIQRTIYKKR